MPSSCHTRPLACLANSRWDSAIGSVVSWLSFPPSALTQVKRTLDCPLSAGGLPDRLPGAERHRGEPGPRFGEHRGEFTARDPTWAVGFYRTDPMAAAIWARSA